MATILVIDDDEDIRALVRATLEQRGHRVVEAENGEFGLAQFRSDPAALVVVDLFMPGIDGWATLRELQAQAPGLPFVIVSGGGALEAVPRGKTGTLASLAGRAAYQVLIKPFSTAALVDAVDTLLTAPNGQPPSCSST